MNTTILNREFQHPADGWYHIEPRGEHPNTEAGVVQIIDDAAVDTIVLAFNRDADAGALSHGREMLIDHEHFSHDSDKETRAFGWLNRLQARPDGIYGQIRWSNTGKAAVDGGDYRFFSTEYDPARCAILNREKPTRLRPLALAGLTLTNRPNNRGAKPITNRTLSPEEPAAPASASADRDHTMKLINAELGLSPEAAETAAVEALRKLMNRATTAESDLAALKPKYEILTNRVGELLDEQIAADLDGHGIKDEAVRNKLIPVLKPMANRAERVDFLALMGTSEPKEAAQPLTNRGTAQLPKGKAGGADEKLIESKKAGLITNRAAQLQRDMPGLSTATAFITAQRAIENEIATGAITLK